MKKQSTIFLIFAVPLIYSMETKPRAALQDITSSAHPSIVPPKLQEQLSALELQIHALKLLQQLGHQVPLEVLQAWQQNFENDTWGLLKRLGAKTQLSTLQRENFSKYIYAYGYLKEKLEPIAQSSRPAASVDEPIGDILTALEYNFKIFLENLETILNKFK